MKKYIKGIIFLYFILRFSSFAYEISDLKFSKEVSLGEEAVKEYTIRNNDSYDVRYSFSIEGAENVKVKPSVLVLSPEEEKKFYIHVKAGNETGKKNYYFVINEKVVAPKTDKAQLYINLKSRIFQEYIVK